MPSVTFVGSLCKTYAVLCSKIADVHGIEVHDVRTWKFVYFRKIFRFFLHKTRDVTKGARGYNSPVPNYCGGPKSRNNIISIFFKTVHFRGAARMRPKRPWPPRKKLVKIFRWCFISISTVRKQTEGTVGLK